MDDKLAKRLGYPRPLEDGSFAVCRGFSWYRLTADEFNQFSRKFVRPAWIRVANIMLACLFVLSMFLFPGGWDSPTIYFMTVVMMIGLVESRVRNKRFRVTFPQAKQVHLARGPWLFQFGLWGAQPICLLIGAGSLLLGWGLADSFPDALMQDWRRQYGLEPGWPGYILFSGIFFLVWSAAWGIRLYYRATRGRQLTYDNLIKTEGLARLVSPT